MDDKERSLRDEKLKTNRASETEEKRKEMLRIRRENKETENHEKRRLATIKRLKRCDDNEFESSLRLEKVVTSKLLRLSVETEEERRARLENDAATKRLRLAMETDEERKSRLEKMVVLYIGPFTRAGAQEHHDTRAWVPNPNLYHTHYINTIFIYIHT